MQAIRKTLVVSVMALLAFGFTRGHAQEFPISTAPLNESDPDVTWDGTNFWVAWVIEDTMQSKLCQICKARITTDGQVERYTERWRCGARPAVAARDTEVCFAYTYIWDGGGIDPTNHIFYNVYDTRSGRQMYGGSIRGYHSDWEELRYFRAVPVFGRHCLFLLTESGFCRGPCLHSCTGVFGVKKDTAAQIAQLAGFQADGICGAWNGETFLAVWTKNPCDTFCLGVTGAFLEDTIASQPADSLEFRIRVDKEFPDRTFGYVFGKEITYTEGHYFLISEMDGSFRSSKIWFDVLSNEGTPICAGPTIVNNGNSLYQEHPTCTHKDNEFLGVWSVSDCSPWHPEAHADLYGITVDTLGELNTSCYIGGSKWSQIQPSVTAGNGKYFLVWADNRNGNYDIYGMLIDSLSCPNKDVAIVSIGSPDDTVYVDSVYTIGTTAKNFAKGTDTFLVVCTIDTGVALFCDSQEVSLEGEKSTSIAFSRQWHVGPDTSITYNVTVSTTLDGDENHSNDTLKFVTRSVGYTAVEEQATLNVQIGPDLQVSPNPFTHNTVVEFVVRLPALPRREQAGGSQPEADEPLAQEFVDEKLTSIKIHDATGRLVKTLINEEKEPGRHTVSFDARGLTAGVYFARLAVGKDHRETKKLILVR